MQARSRAGAPAVIFAALLALASGPASSGEDTAAWGYARFRTDLEALGRLAPRLEGSAQERAAIEYLRIRLEAMGAPVRVVSYAESETVHSFSSGLEATIAGGAAGTLIVVVPVDHAIRAPAGREGSAGLALGLALVESLVRSRPPLSVRVLFLGAEHGAGDEYPIGSRRYIEAFSPEGPTAVLYLEIPTAPARLEVRGGTNGTVSPQWLVGAVTRWLGRSGVPFLLRGNESQIYRLGAAAKAGPVAPFLRAGIAALALEAAGEAAQPSAEPTETEVRAWLGEVGGFFAGLVEDLGRGMPEEWDRHYLSFQIGGRGITIPETVYVAALCALVAACLLYTVLSGRHGRRYAGALLRGSWSMPVHLALLFLYAVAPTLAIELLLSALDFPTLWQVAPLQLILFKVLVGVALFSIVTPLVTRSPFPGNDSFFAAAAILSQSAALVAVASYEVSLAYYFAWSLAFLLASAVARDRSAKVLLFAVAPAWLVRAAVELLWLREPVFVRWILLDRLWGNAVLTAAIAPFYFMALRLRLLFPIRHPVRRRLIILAAGFACLLAAAATAVWVGYLRPYRGGADRPIAARAVFDFEQRTAGLDLECPTAIREYTVVAKGEETRVVTRARHAQVPLELPGEPLVVTSTGSAFLDRQNVLLYLSPAAEAEPWPYRLALRLVGDVDYVLFDASLPFVRDPSGTEYLIRVGANPPSPLRIELTLPRGVAFALRIDAEYLMFPSGLAVQSPGAVVEPSTEVRSVYRFRS